MNDKLTEAVERRRRMGAQLEEINGLIDSLQLRLAQLKADRTALQNARAALNAEIKAEAVKL